MTESRAQGVKLGFTFTGRLGLCWFELCKVNFAVCLLVACLLFLRAVDRFSALSLHCLVSDLFVCLFV